MRYKGSNFVDAQKATNKLKKLIEQGKTFELTEKRPKRTISQNSFLHLILSWFGYNFGYSLEEVKQEIFKKIVNPETFYDGEFGELVKIERWRSTADLNTAELTLCIDRFRNYSAKECDLYLPEPKDLNHLEQIEIELNNNKEFL